MDGSEALWLLVLPKMAPDPQWDRLVQGPVEAQPRWTGVEPGQGRRTGVCGCVSVLCQSYFCPLSLPGSRPVSEVPSPSPSHFSLVSCTSPAPGAATGTTLTPGSGRFLCWDSCSHPGVAGLGCQAQCSAQFGDRRARPGEDPLPQEKQMARAAGLWNLAASEAKVM